MRIDGSHVRRVSNGKRKDDLRLLPGRRPTNPFRIESGAGARLSTSPDPSKGYVWRLDPFDIYTARPDGSGLRRLTRFGVYTAEGVVSPNGRKVVFTSLKNGDLDIYIMNIDGSNLKQLTHQLGYDGGPWWSPDGKRIVYRANHPQTAADIATYKELLDQRSSGPNKMDLWIMNADGSDQRQITRLGAASFGPVVDAGWKENHLLVEHHHRSEAWQLRFVPDQS